METVFICSVGIYRSEKSSSIKINMSMTQNFSMLHSDIYYNTAKLGRLTCFKSLRDIVNKIHRQYSFGWCGDKKEGIFLSVDPFKEKNKSTSDPLSGPSAGGSYDQSQWNYCHGCSKLYIWTFRNTHLSGPYLFSNGGWKKIIIYRFTIFFIIIFFIIIIFFFWFFYMTRACTYGYGVGNQIGVGGQEC